MLSLTKDGNYKAERPYLYDKMNFLILRVIQKGNGSPQNFPSLEESQEKAD